MKKIVMAALALAAVLPAAAQDTYESARLLGSDLNGTARYVGMGGAMDALGADISTISTNPAGIGLFRHSTINLSLGLQSQMDVEKFDGLNKTVMSFDQMGFVYSQRISDRSFINVGFNYHKSRNFDQILSAANSLSGCSQNGLTFEKGTLDDARHGGYTLDFNKDGDVIGWDGGSDYRAQTYSQADYMNANVLLLDPDDEYFYFNDANAYSFDRAHRGWIADYDFNISGNHQDRFYWGITIGVKDVHYKGYSEYAETLLDNTGVCGSVAYGDERKIKGTGFDVKAGVIIRPIEDSPFRFGLSVSTPTWYSLTSIEGLFPGILLVEFISPRTLEVEGIQQIANSIYIERFFIEKHWYHTMCTIIGPSIDDTHCRLLLIEIERLRLCIVILVGLIYKTLLQYTVLTTVHIDGIGNLCSSSVIQCGSLCQHFTAEGIDGISTCLAKA